MKKRISPVAMLFVLFSFAGVVTAQVDLDTEREQIIKESIPDGMAAVTKPVWGRFAESASKDTGGNGVVLYQKATNTNTYEGKVLVPEGFEVWNVFSLPEPDESWSMMKPVSILFANTDGDADNELLIIDEYYTGIGPTGARPFYRTRVYDFNGIGFLHRDDLSKEIGNVNTAAKVRTRLGQMGNSIKHFQTPMYERVYIGELNQQIITGNKAGESWAKDPNQIAVKLVGTFSDAVSRTIEMRVPYVEGSKSMTVIITDDGLSDDSVRSMRHRIELSRDDRGNWTIESAGKAWRCQQGRGSQTYSNKLCV